MVRINLLPVKVSKKKEAGKQQLLLFALLLIAGIVANGWWQQSRAKGLDVLEARVKKTKSDIAQLDKIIGEVKSIRQQQQALREKLDVLDKLKKARTGPVRMLDELATITPRRLWLRKLQEKEGKVIFEGTASTIDDVSAFMSALNASKYLGGVELKKTDAKAVGNQFRVVDFTISALAKYAPKLPETTEAKPGPAAKPPAAPKPAKGGD
jgi:type IV pilus assembly protein PilN